MSDKMLRIAARNENGLAKSLQVDEAGNLQVVTNGYRQVRAVVTTAANGNHYLVGKNTVYTGRATGFVPFDVQTCSKKTIIVKNNTTTGLRVNFLLLRTTAIFDAPNLAFFETPDYDKVLYVSDERIVSAGGVLTYSTSTQNVDEYNDTLDKYAYGAIAVHLQREIPNVGGTGEAIVIMTGGN